MIRLEGGFEVQEYWEEVRKAGDDRLEDAGFQEWVVTLRPSAAGPDEQRAVNVNAAARTLEVAVEEQPDLPPDSFVQTSIIDVIEKATGEKADDVFEDLLRDEGGEA